MRFQKATPREIQDEPGRPQHRPKIFQKTPRPSKTAQEPTQRLLRDLKKNPSISKKPAKTSASGFQKTSKRPKTIDEIT